MKFTPDYGVFYRDGYHPAGRPFEIDAKDAEEMKAHGTVEGARQESILVNAPAPDPAPKRTRKAK